MDGLIDEVDALEAILMDDVRITRNSEDKIELIETTVFPVDDESELCVTLQVIPTPGYPSESSPEFKLLRPRGLDDSRLEAIKAAIQTKIQASVGFAVVFDLIEVVRDHLTGSPSGQCVICLYGFSDGDEFTRTECFHYLHSFCLARHVNAMRRNYQEEYDKLPAWQQKDAEPFKNICPVCRETIKDDSDSLKCAMPPAELMNAPDFRLTRELRELQQRMSSLFLQQKSRGGIIDVDAETGGGVISIETEEDIRRRMQRRQQQNIDTGADAFNSACGLQETSHNSESAETVASADQQDQHNTRHCNKSSSNSASSNTNFAPVVQQTQHTDPTNNNYHHHQHNRRRGGRRQQHHHHRERERDRERFEQHNQHASNTVSSSGSTAHHQSATGKQTKAQTAGANG